jgi:hypothetical protein
MKSVRAERTPVKSVQAHSRHTLCAYAENEGVYRA